MSNAVVTIKGNLTTDPELKFTKGGQARLPFSVASTKSWKDNNGDWQEETSFFNVVAWRGIAETAAPILQKGLPVIVTGALEQRSWENDEGEKRSTVEINAQSVGVNCIGIDAVTRKERGQKTGGNQPSPAAAAPMDEEPF